MVNSVVAPSKAERRRQGKALREKCPRTSQAEWKPRSKSVDIVQWLEESDADRIPGLIPVKYQRMAVSPFTFYRGFLAGEDDPLFLQVKEARRSVLESPRGKSRFANQGYRVVTGQRLMQAASDIFLGWFGTAQGHDYYIRQFRDTKVSAEVETFRPDSLAAYATMCGWALARGPTPRQATRQ